MSDTIEKEKKNRIKKVTDINQFRHFVNEFLKFYSVVDASVTAIFGQASDKKLKIRSQSKIEIREGQNKANSK
ncbi:MAG: hypothetical protein ACI90V_010689 [Bacillariaceae sp.]|jgi:hypothetical protein